MKDRYKPIAIVIGAIFAANLVCSLFADSVFKHSDTGQNTAGFVFLGIVALIMLGASYWWSLAHPLSRVVPDLLLALALACVLSVFVVPAVHATDPFTGGAGFFFEKIWLFMGFGIGGAVLGSLFAIALGRDYRSKALSQYTKVATAKPRRVVRR